MMRHLLGAMAEAAELSAGAADFAAAQIQQLPPLPRFALRMLAGVFYLHAKIAGEMPRARWRDSSLPPCRDFVLLCDSLLLFAHYAAARGEEEGA